MCECVCVCVCVCVCMCVCVCECVCVCMYVCVYGRKCRNCVKSLMNLDDSIISVTKI